MGSLADSGSGMNWKDALSWIQGKNAVNDPGWYDWRFPDAIELLSSADYP